MLELGAENHFSAVGSRQGTFVLKSDMVLETQIRESIDEFGAINSVDAHLRTTGERAALVIQGVEAPRTVFAFVSIPRTCHPAGHGCADYEVDLVLDATRAEYDPDPDNAPHYLMPAGRYVIALLGDDGAESSASLFLSETSQAPYGAERTADSARQHVRAALGVPIPLVEPSEAVVLSDVHLDAQTDLVSGSLAAQLGVVGVAAGGMTTSWQTSANPSRHDIDACLTWSNGDRNRCAHPGLSSSCLCPLGQGGTWGPLNLTTDPAAAAGTVRWDYMISGPMGLGRVVSWLLVWPYVI